MGNWTSQIKVNAAAMRCIGIARQFFCSNPGLKKHSWEELQTKLIEQFHPKTNRATLQNQLMATYQGTGENVRDFGQRFNWILNQLDGAQDVPASEEAKMRRIIDRELVRNRFVEGLLPHLKRDLLLSKPITFEEAIKRALEIEEVEREVNRDRFRIGATNLESNRTWHPQPSRQFQTSQRTRPFTTPPPTCSFCSIVGHQENQCRRKNGACLACGEKSHSIRNCPRRNHPNAHRPLGRS